MWALYNSDKVIPLHPVTSVILVPLYYTHDTTLVRSKRYQIVYFLYYLLPYVSDRQKNKPESYKMYKVGNVADNLGRDSSEIPASLIKTLRSRHQSLRDPFLLQRDDTAFNDMIRQLAFEELERPTSSGDECEKASDLDMTKSSGTYATARDDSTIASRDTAFFSKGAILSANKRMLGARRRCKSVFKLVLARLCNGG